MKNEQDTVVGIFLDQAHAQQAIQQLQSAGFKAKVENQGNMSAYQSMNQDERKLYESRANDGNVVVVVNNAGERGEEAVGLMLQCGAENIEMDAEQGSGAMQQSNSGSNSRNANYYQNLGQQERQYGQVDKTTRRGKNANEMRVALREETLNPVKQSTQAGEVQVSKVVHEKQQEVPVNLRHEEVTIERHAVDRPLAPGEITDMKDEVIRVPVYEERAELQKQSRVREEAVIKKEAVEEQTTLTGTTRHEHLDVKQEGNVNVQGGTESGYQNTQTDTNTYRQD